MSTAAIAVEAVVGGLVTAAIGGVGWLLADKLKSVDAKLDKVAEQATATAIKVAVVEADTRNNGGSSSRDLLERIEATGNQTASALTSHLIHAAGQDARLDALTATVNGRA